MEQATLELESSDDSNEEMPTVLEPQGHSGTFCLLCVQSGIIFCKYAVWLANNLQGLIEICALYQLGGLCCIALAFWICPLPNMTYPLFSILRLVLGTLYPAYASYKAVRTKDVKEYVSFFSFL